jgi:MoxR-like ATPase
MYDINSLGPLRVVSYRQGRRVRIATTLAVGDIEFPAPENPRLLLVPANVAFLQQMWDALRMPSRNNLLVTGESGSGKTTLVRYLGEIYRSALLQRAATEQEKAVAAHLCARAASFQTRILTFHENLRRSDITERRHFGETGEEKTGWSISDVMDGMVAGDWNVLSEINRTGEDVQAEFNEPLENKAKSLHQRVIRGHPDARFIATINPVKSEGRGIYEGKVMSGEFVNRFTNKVHLCYLPPDEEFEVLKDYGPNVDDRIIDRLLAVASDIRRDYAEEHGVAPFPVTTRALIRMVRHLGMFPDDTRVLRSLFWKKACWLDDRIHPPIAVRLIGNLLDLHDIRDRDGRSHERSHVVAEGKDQVLRIGAASCPLGPGGPYVPGEVIEEVQQNLADLEWILKDIALGENILLIGEAGVGKNKLESYLASLLRWNLLVVGMSGETRVSDLLTYRSFGEEEAGRTGDTATLGLQALTDEDQRWMIVLDEANKAQQGVLVSFNDLLQDRLVRLPGGAEVPVRATICVNINPNRPPYEVNDFSFEFMDRFSIHTIVHLPPDQAVDVLAKKYPLADLDFIRDVVNGYYALHPLYSGGVLFEPVTMRNEEAAIERGLQYPQLAGNLIDLLCTGYGPRDARELKAIRNVLEAQGFDRNVLAASSALLTYRSAWEADKDNEESALFLAQTYQAIGKPSAALDVYREMISRHPGRDWIFHLRSAAILLSGGLCPEAEDELRKAFPVCGVVEMDGEYRIFSPRIRIDGDKARVSVEAQELGAGGSALLVSCPGNRPAATINRLSGSYHLSKEEEGLCIYVRPGGEEGEEPHPSPGRKPLSGLVREIVQLIGSGHGLLSRACELPSPPWEKTRCRAGRLERELVRKEKTIRFSVQEGGGWSIEESDSLTIGWKETEGSGEFFFSRPGETVARLPSAADPFLNIGWRDASPSVCLVLSGDLPVPAEWRSGAGGDLAVLSPESFQKEILSSLYASLLPRLQQLFRYSRPLSRSPALGAGDVVYTLLPDSRIGVSILVETDGIEPVFVDLTAGHDEARPIPAITDRTTGVYRTHIPFPLLDACKGWQDRAASPAVQGYLKELRGYLASSLLLRNKPRDLPFEARARAVLTGYGPVAEPVSPEGTVLSKGDVLVRTGPGAADIPRSVFIVRFVMEESEKRWPLVRGFWLAEGNPVATESFEKIAGNFGRMVVTGDDRHARLIRQLVAACQRSARPWQFSRTGKRSELAERFDLDGLKIENYPTERRFRLTVPLPDGPLTLEETGYPLDSTLVNPGSHESSSWTGTPIIDIRYQPDEGRVLVVLEDAFLAFLQQNRFIGDESVPAAGEIQYIILSRTEAWARGMTSLKE